MCPIVNHGQQAENEEEYENCYKFANGFVDFAFLVPSDDLDE